MLSPVLVTPPAEPVLTLVEAKAALRVDFADDDALITALVSAATGHLEGKLQRAFVTQTWRATFDSFGSTDKPIRLPLQPVQSVASVTYYDDDNASQTLASTVYQLLYDEMGAYLSLKVDQEWPDIYARPDGISVQFVAGYGLAAAVPEEIKVAIRLHVRMNYDQLSGPEREATEHAIKALTDLFRVFR